MSIPDLKREAKERGLRWADVRAVHAQIKQEVWAARERPNAIRATAWQMHTASRPGCWDFWRHGFWGRFGRRINQGADYTIIPGYDEIAQGIASEFPEFDVPDGTDRLWDFLLSTYEPYPPAATLYRQAMDRLEAVGSEETAEVPF